ncbi:hypothetical protein [Nitrosopumilus sp.]|uniref:hypothetical protein n=1 Tax=Nitrosopumilus sp. TaxID=2024843 RepID=UPI00261C85BB|nr:hypothetical protein [Nitrosopumilus sp.]
MGKIKIRTGRGTGTMEVDSDPSKWSGDEFKKIQAARKAASAGRTVSSGRGTGRRKLSDIPEPKERPEYKGTISSGRGTGSRKK